jgi:hypothetical protein
MQGLQCSASMLRGCERQDECRLMPWSGANRQQWSLASSGWPTLGKGAASSAQAPGRGAAPLPCGTTEPGAVREAQPLGNILFVSCTTAAVRECGTGSAAIVLTPKGSRLPLESAGWPQQTASLQYHYTSGEWGAGVRFGFVVNSFWPSHKALERTRPRVCDMPFNWAPPGVINDSTADQDNAVTHFRSTASGRSAIESPAVSRADRGQRPHVFSLKRRGLDGPHWHGGV